MNKTEKKKIILIYTGVAFLSVLILSAGIFLGKARRQHDRPVVEAAGKVEVVELIKLEEDIELTRQDGAQVKLSDLHDKVWIAAQFYASCPMCAKRNAGALIEVYRKFQDDPDFKVVCLSVDPAQDTNEHLQAMQEQMDVDGESWWFLKAEQEKIWDYMRNVMYFTDIRERTVPEEIAAKGRWSHDLGLQIYRGDALVGRWDEGRSREALFQEVESALKTLESGE